MHNRQLQIVEMISRNEHNTKFDSLQNGDTLTLAGFDRVLFGESAPVQILEVVITIRDIREGELV